MFDRILKDSTPIERTFHTEYKDQSEDFLRARAYK